MKQEFLENPLIISNRLVFSCLNGDGAAYCLKSDSGFSNLMDFPRIPVSSTNQNN
jgi:hypothetical protein